MPQRLPLIKRKKRGKALLHYGICTNFAGMKNTLLTLLTASLLIACGRSENTNETTTQAADSVATTAGKPQNCQSVVDTARLGKPFEYQESAKPIKVTLTLNPDTSTVQTTGNCYTNTAVTVTAVRKSGKFLFKRTLNKDDLIYFVDTDSTVRASVLENVTYKATFNGQPYFNLTMHLLEPVSKKTTDYTLFMNYYGEIVKVR